MHDCGMISQCLPASGDVATYYLRYVCMFASNFAVRADSGPMMPTRAVVLSAFQRNLIVEG